MIYFGLAVSCSALAACGGAIQQEEESPESAGAPKTTLSTPAPAAGTPFGAWELVSLQGMPGGKQSTQTSNHLSLELRSDGSAVARLCTKPYFEVGQSSYRCAESSAYDCLYGSVVSDGVTWRVKIPGLVTTSKESSGEIIADTTDLLVVRYVLPKYAAGTFVRVTDEPSTHACAGP